MPISAGKQKAPQQEARSATSARQGRSGTGREAGSILHLQRSLGNQAVQRFLKATAKAEAPSKPAIVAPTNTYEQEAERAAEQVTRQPKPVVGSSERGVGSGRAMQRSDRPLSPRERAFFEPHFGQDFSRVRIHADARSAEMAEALNAEAFTVGHDVYFGPGKLQPETRESDQLLAHELAHVAQQSRMGSALQRKLKFTGKPADVARAIDLLNSGLQQYRVSIDKSGNVSITMNSVEKPPNPQQQALADRLTNVINDPKDVVMTVSSGSKTLGGSYATGDFDIADLETYGVPGLIHEIEEQFQKQVKGLAFGSETTGAHSEAIKAESEVRGAKRGAQKVISSTSNADGTMDAVVEIPHTYPDGTIKIMVMTIKSNNIESVTWK